LGNSSRQAAKAVYGVVYSQSEMPTDPACVYCGEPYDVMDHVPPLHYVARVKTTTIPILVPSCGECNRYLGGLLLLTLRDRAAHVSSKLRKKFASLLSAPEWTQSDLRELGDEMRRDVERSVNLRPYVANAPKQNPSEIEN
jgi:hypothetical protein